MIIIIYILEKFSPSLRGKTTIERWVYLQLQKPGNFLHEQLPKQSIAMQDVNTLPILLDNYYIFTIQKSSKFSFAVEGAIPSEIGIVLSQGPEVHI